MFSVEVHQNQHLPEGEGHVEAILRVTAPASDASTAEGERVEGLVLDVSPSMEGEKLRYAKAAAEKALDLIAEDAWFFVVSFSSTASVVQTLVKGTPANRERAKAAVRSLVTSGGTWISAGLTAAKTEVEKKRGARAHVIFLTDGQNNDEDKANFPRALASCENVFQADCRGVGTDWSTTQLSVIASTLLGTAKIVAEPAGLEEDFRQAIQGSAGRVLGNVRLRLVTPKSGKAKVAFLKQASPSLLDLSSRSTKSADGSLEYPTGAWAPGESRDYHVAFDVEPGAAGDEMLVCRPNVVHASPEVVTRGKPVLAVWTKVGDERSALLNSHVAHYTGQTKLSDDIRQGLEARAKGDVEKATEFLGRAVKTAKESGNEEVTVKLKAIVEERADGTVALKRDASKASVMDLDLSSIVTSRSKTVAPGTTS